MKSLLYKKTLILGVFLLPFLLIPGQVDGQADSVRLSVSPQFPEPHEQVTISVSSQLVNFNNKQIIWRKDGEIIESGVGVDEINTTVGSAGETTVINLKTRTDEEIVEKEISITPVDVDLIWESIESYTPPFYKGKALHPGWGDVRISVLTNIRDRNGGVYSKDELTYTWKYNGLVYGDDSGRGESSFVTGTVPRRGNRVSVDIETPGGDLIATESITLPINEPELLIYKNSPLLGSQLGSVVEEVVSLDSSEMEISLIAYPYFYLKNSAISDTMQYEWEMNGEELTPPEHKNIVRLRRQDNASGRARISVEVDDASRIFSSQSANITLEF